MSQFAVLLASQIPLKSGFPATRPGESATAAETDGAFGVKSQKRPAVTAAADKAMAQLWPKYRIEFYLVANIVLYLVPLRRKQHGHARGCGEGARCPHDHGQGGVYPQQTAGK